MPDQRIFPVTSPLYGELSLPPSKSHTLRAFCFAALASGISSIRSPLVSPDAKKMLDALHQLGAPSFRREDGSIQISGTGGILSPALKAIDCGNSGQVLRFVGAIAGALLPSYTFFDGDHSLRTRRPLWPLIDGLQQLGGFALPLFGNGHVPMVVRGPLCHRFACIDGADSQPVSGLLIAAAFAAHPIEIEVVNPGEKEWVDLTLDWFRRLGIPYDSQDHRLYRLEGGSQLQPFDYLVPGDFSSAAFPIAAALITGSTLVLKNLDPNDAQGDRAIIPLLQKMGAELAWQGVNPSQLVVRGDRTAGGGCSLQGRAIDLSPYIDALPILAVLASYASGPTELYNAEIARYKESDRLYAITQELRKMGAKIEEKQERLIVYPALLRGAEVESHSDHRIAMALAVAALGAEGATTIRDVECIAKSYPHFFEALQSIGVESAPCI